LQKESIHKKMWMLSFSGVFVLLLDKQFLAIANVDATWETLAWAKPLACEAVSPLPASPRGGVGINMDVVDGTWHFALSVEVEVEIAEC
jgi:hypothetical protein